MQYKLMDLRYILRRLDHDRDGEVNLLDFSRNLLPNEVPKLVLNLSMDKLDTKKSGMSSATSTPSSNLS